MPNAKIYNYKGTSITDYGNTCFVFFCGDELFFSTLEQAMEFIDTLVRKA